MKLRERQRPLKPQPDAVEVVRISEKDSEEQRFCVYTDIPSELATSVELRIHEMLSGNRDAVLNSSYILRDLLTLYPSLREGGEGSTFITHQVMSDAQRVYLEQLDSENDDLYKLHWRATIAQCFPNKYRELPPAEQTFDQAQEMIEKPLENENDPHTVQLTKIMAYHSRLIDLSILYPEESADLKVHEIFIPALQHHLERARREADYVQLIWCAAALKIFAPEVSVQVSITDQELDEIKRHIVENSGIHFVVHGLRAAINTLIATTDRVVITNHGFEFVDNAVLSESEPLPPRNLS